MFFSLQFVGWWATLLHCYGVTLGKQSRKISPSILWKDKSDQVVPSQLCCAVSCCSEPFIFKNWICWLYRMVKGLLGNEKTLLRVSGTVLSLRRPASNTNYMAAVSILFVFWHLGIFEIIFSILFVFQNNGPFPDEEHWILKRSFISAWQQRRLGINQSQVACAWVEDKNTIVQLAIHGFSPYKDYIIIHT